MRSLLCRLAATLLVSLAWVPTVAAQKTADVRRPGPADYANVSLAFEENEGQAGTDVRFLARTPGYAVWLTDSGPVYSLGQSAASPPVRMRFSGGAHAAPTRGVEALPTVVSYLLGSDRTRWRTGIPTYRKVRYEAIYPGIDAVCYGTGRRMEFDFIVAPGADPRAIALTFDEADGLRVDGAGDLLVGRQETAFRLSRPEIYQEAGGVRTPVNGRYLVDADRTVRFSVDDYDTSRPGHRPMTLSGPVDFPAGTMLSAKVYVRNACMATGKNSGRARLWYGDAAADSRMGATIDGATTFYLLDGFALGASPGAGPKKTIDIVAGAKCSPFKLFGTWSGVP